MHPRDHVLALAPRAFVRAQAVDQPLQPERVLGRIEGFGDAVGIRQQGGAGRQPAPPQRELAADLETQRGTRGDRQRFAGAVGMQQDRCVVAGAGQHALAAARVHAAEQHGGEHAGVVAFHQPSRGFRQHGRRRITGPRRDLQHGDRAGHEQRRRHALVGYVADGEPQAAVAAFDETVEIPAHGLGRLQQGEHFQVAIVAVDDPPRRQHRQLDVAGDRQLAFQLLPRRAHFLDFRQLPLDRRAGVFQRACHQSHLVGAAGIGHRGLVVAFGQVGGRGGQLFHRLADAAGQAPDDEGAEQRQHQSAGQQPQQRLVEPGHHQCVGLRHQQGPAALADRFDHGEALLPGQRIGVHQLQVPVQADRVGGGLQVGASGAADVLFQGQVGVHPHVRVGGQGAGRCHQRDPPAGQVGQAFEAAGELGQRHVQADHAAGGDAAASRAQRAVVGHHPDIAGGPVEIGLGPPAARGGHGAPVPALRAVVVTVGDEIAVPAFGADIAREWRLAGLFRFHHQQPADAAGGGADHRPQRGGQLGRIQVGVGQQVGQAAGGDDHRAQCGVEPFGRFLGGGDGVAAGVFDDQPAREPGDAQHQQQEHGHVDHARPQRDAGAQAPAPVHHAGPLRRQSPVLPTSLHAATPNPCDVSPCADDTSPGCRARSARGLILVWSKPPGQRKNHESIRPRSQIGAGAVRYTSKS